MKKVWTDDETWALRQIHASATKVDVISINLTKVHNVGLDVKKIVKNLSDAGIYIRETGVCSAVEIRPKSYESADPKVWAQHLIDHVNANWETLRRDGQ